MFSNLQSFFNYIGGTHESSNNTIKSVLTKKGIQFSDIQSGINVNFNDEYDVVFPSNVKESNYIYVKKNLKDKDGKVIKCIYNYKLEDNKLNFINRIKLINRERKRSKLQALNELFDLFFFSFFAQNETVSKK